MFKTVTLIAAFFSLFALFLVRCKDLETSDISKNAREDANEMNKTDIIRKSDDVFINTEGWNVPKLGKQKVTKTTKSEVKDKSGTKKPVILVDYVLDDTFTDEPFNLIGVNYGKIKISSVREFKNEEKVFAYLIFAQKATYDKSTKSYKPIGNFFFYAFLDDNGDGKFETLLRSPESQLIIPDWALQN